MGDEDKEQSDTLVLKVLIWAIPVVFGAGALFQMVQFDDASLSDLGKKVAAHDEGLDQHEALPGHPVSMTQIDHLAEQQDTMVVEQRAMRDEQRGISMDLAAICQATGAECGAR